MRGVDALGEAGRLWGLITSSRRRDVSLHYCCVESNLALGVEVFDSEHAGARC